MEVDKPSVGTRIVKLLFNSFVPSDKGEDTKIERCIYLIKSNRNASRKFYEYSEEMLTLHDTVKFMLAILAYLRKHVKNMFASESSDEDDGNKENGFKRPRPYADRSKHQTKKRKKLHSAGDVLNETSDESLSTSTESLSQVSNGRRISQT